MSYLQTHYIATRTSSAISLLSQYHVIQKPILSRPRGINQRRAHREKRYRERPFQRAVVMPVESQSKRIGVDQSR